MDPRGILEQTIELAHAAADLLAAEFTREGGPRGSGSQAAIDLEIETMLRKALLDLHRCSYVGEETGDAVDDGSVDCWLVDPHDGTSAFLKGHRGTAVSIALLRDGVPVLGVVCAPMPPDRGRDCIAWAEGMDGILRNGQVIRPSLAGRGLMQGEIVFLNHESRKHPVAFGKAVAPARFVALPSIAYRLARVAVGDGVAAVSLSGPVSFDYAAGHAIVRGAGGVLLDETGAPVTYTRTGGGGVRRCFGGSAEAAGSLANRSWSTAGSAARKPQPPSRAVWTRSEPERSRARGSLMGQLVGDGLGSLVEFKSAATIKKLYPDGVRRLADGGVWNTLAGQPTDDSELALALARTLVRTRDWDDEAVAEAYGNWCASHPFDIGSTTRIGLEAAAGATEDKAAAARKAANPKSQSNGSLMRISPVGIWGRYPKLAAYHAEKDSALSHPNPVCRAACASFAAAIAEGIRTGEPGSMLHVARMVLHDDDSGTLAKHLWAATEGHAPVGADGGIQGFVGIAYQNAFHHLARRTPIAEALTQTIALGGDTDTNAAICGALLGAAYGIEAIPTEMTLAVLSCRPHRDLGAGQPRPEEYWPDDALELADALLEAMPQFNEPFGLGDD